MTNSTRFSVAAISLTLTLAACAPESEPNPGEQGMPESMEGLRDTSGMGRMQGEGGDMMSRMSAHLAMMRGMRADSLQSLLATHRQLVANMIAQMNREMREMDMVSDEAWDATVDSLRNDLVRMPEMDATELEALMPGHERRAVRLMEMHREMMEEMEM